ncbi:hypothetical protein QCA50_015139 [Cerrena zonata]|uniref:Uncharacterized protein n=1 Tax=Cerrena zonata TaxID=2478898 RepID=A0AAW0FWV2_9APHY
MRAPILSFLALLTLIYCVFINVSTTTARAYPNAVSGNEHTESHHVSHNNRSPIVDGAHQNNVQELLRTLSIFGDAKQKFLDIVHGGMEQTHFDFWKQANSLGQKLQKYSESLIDDAKSQVQEAAERIEEVRQIVHDLVTSVNHLHADLASHLTDDVTTESLSQDLEDALLPIVEKLHEMFPAPDHAPHHDERERAVRELLDKIEEKIVAVGTKHGLDEAVLRRHIETINPLVLKLVVLIGDLSEQHPILRDMLIFTVVGLIIPESWILRPILRIFGFGPAGPAKGRKPASSLCTYLIMMATLAGSAASWSQRYFYGAAVKKGTWFSNMQRAGMTVVPPGTGKKVVGGIGAGVGLGLSFMRC